MRKLLTALFITLLILGNTLTISADEIETYVLTAGTSDYTYLNHPSYNEEIKNIVVAEGVEYIGDYTFFRSDIEEVVLPSTLKEIGDYAFYECTSLVSINLDNVESIGKYAFYGCENLNVEFTGTKGAHALDFEGDKQLSYDMSLARFEAAVDYLDDVYLITDLGFEIDYCSPLDIKMLQELADHITEDCDTETEKAHAIYDYVYNNIGYGFTGYSAIDVFRTGQGVCAGQSQLLAALMKLSGMPTTIVRVLKENTTARIDYLGIDVSLNYTYTKAHKYHEFVITHADNEWKAYDCLFDLDGETDATVWATNNWLIHVDGVGVYSDEGTDEVKWCTANDIYYKDGQWESMNVNYPKGSIGDSSLSVGGCIVYDKSTWYGLSYYNYLGTKTNIRGNAFAGGWYDLLNMPSLRSYILDNGVQFRSGIKEDNDSKYLFYNGCSIKIDDSLLDIGMTNGALNMYIGEELDFNSDDMSIKSVSNNKVLVDGNTIKAVSQGKTYVTFFIEGHVTALNRTGIEVVIEVNVYGDVQTSNELFQTLCDHDTTHEVYEDEYCDYCGALIEEEQEEQMEEEQPEEHETVEEEVVEEPSEEQEIIEEEIIEEEESEEVEQEEIQEEQEEEQPEEVYEEEPEDTSEEQEEPEVEIEEPQEEQNEPEQEEIIVPDIQEEEEETPEVIAPQEESTPEHEVQRPQIIYATYREYDQEETYFETIPEQVEAIQVIEAPKIVKEEAIIESQEQSEGDHEELFEEDITPQDHLEVSPEAQETPTNDSIMDIVLVALIDFLRSILHIFKK